METIDTLYFKDLTFEEKELASSIINRFGTGQHPCAEVSNINGFAVSYLKEILDSSEFKNAAAKLSEVGQKTLEGIQSKL